MPLDEFKDPFVGVTSPGRNGFVIAPSDSTPLKEVIRGLYVGTAGNVQVLLSNDSTAVVFQNVPAGSLLPLRVAQVFATNTSAGAMVGIY